MWKLLLIEWRPDLASSSRAVIEYKSICFMNLILAAATFSTLTKVQECDVCDTIFVVWTRPIQSGLLFSHCWVLESVDHGDCHMISFNSGYCCTFLYIFCRILCSSKHSATAYIPGDDHMISLYSSHSCTSKMSNWDFDPNRSTNKRLVVPPSQLNKWIIRTRPCTTVRDSEDILEQSSFQKYTTCWVFLAFRHMLY